MSDRSWLDFEEDEGETLNGRSGGERLAFDLFSLSPPVPRSTAGDDRPRPEPACRVRPGLSPSTENLKRIARRVEVAAIVVAAAAFVAAMIGFACGWRW